MNMGCGFAKELRADSRFETGKNLVRLRWLYEVGAMAVIWTQRTKEPDR